MLTVIGIKIQFNIYWTPLIELRFKLTNSSLFSFRFQKACVKYGVPDTDLFQTTDLFDRKNIALVTTTVFAVGRVVSPFDN